MGHKMLRDLRHHFASFFSVLLLAALAMSLFCTFEGHVLSQRVARENFHDKCNLSDVWVYSEKLTTENLEDVKDLSFVKKAQLRTFVKGSTPDFKNVQVDLYLEREDTVNKPYLIQGEKFDPSDTSGIWIANAFAKRRNLNIGDQFSISYNGVTFTKEIKGFIESSEYEFRQADNDADMYLENMAIVYMSYDAFPTRDYVNHLIDQGKITSENIQPYVSMDLSGMNASMLKQMVGNMSDDQLNRFMPYTQMVIRTKDGKGLDHESKLKKVLGKDYSVMVDRDSIPGLARLDSELDQHESFSYMFVVIFVGIAILVIATSMSRIVENERTAIGTLNAMGMKRYKIVLHYLSFSIVVSVLGVLIGLWIGVAYLCPFMMDLFASWYVVPGLHSTFHIMYAYLGLAIILACVLSAYLSIRKILNLSPAQALRPSVPKSGSTCFWERFKFWQKLSFSLQYNIRDVSRAKLRSLMCVIGTAVGMLLMVYGVGCTHLLDTMENDMFEIVEPSKYQVKLSEDISLDQANQLKDDLNGELVMMDAIEVSKIKNPSKDQKKKENITVLDGKHLYNLLEENSDKAVDLKKGSVGVSRKLSKDLDIHVGDTIYWHLYSKNTWHKAKVGVIYRSNETQGIAYLTQDYKKIGETYSPSLLMTNQNPKDYKDASYITSISSKKELIKAYEKSMEVIDFLVYMMVGFASILILVVLYNSGSLSFNERKKELATLKVVGMRSSDIRRLMTMQNVFLSMIGILIGSPLGQYSLNVMMNMNGENFDYSLSLEPMDYLISGILVLGVSLLVGFLFNSRIKKLDLIEILKGNE